MHSDLRGVVYINNSLNIKQITGNETCLESLRIAGSIHKMIRKDFQPMLKPGLNLCDLSNFINSQTRKYIKMYSKCPQYNDGIAFPPILSMSNIIAHYSPYKESKILTYDDNLKIDFGVHINGWIVDSASTIYFNPEYYTLHYATKEALYSALKIVNIDTPIDDVSSIIEEIITSYEILYKGNIIPLKVIDSCSGHNIKQYDIHGGITIPNKSTKQNSKRFTSGVYAIEPFASILSSKCMEGPERNNYRIKKEYMNLSNPLYKCFNNLIFTDSHLDYYNLYLDKNIVNIYPALHGIKGDMTCQYEHTIYLDESTKEIISKWDDY